MQDIINIYRTKNHYLAILKEVATKYDGKVINKRFNTFLDKYNINFDWNGIHSDFWSMDIPNGSYGNKVFLTIYSSDRQEYISKDNRLIAEGLIKLIDEQLQHNMKEIHKMEQDQTNKDSLIDLYNNLVDDIEKLTKSMSYEFRQKYKNEFKSVIYKCGR